MAQPFATVSIDIDGIGCYHAIHGLPSPDGEDPVYLYAIPRFLELIERLGLRATLFVVGGDLSQSAARATLSAAAQGGHEIASHSYSHDYRLTKQPALEIRREVERAHRALTAVAGSAPRGFRAPGYNTTDVLLGVLEELGYLYDSSIFPAPAYYALRAAAIGYYRWRGDRSRSLAGDPRQFLGPRAPYRPRRGRPHRRGGREGRRLVELPIAVALPLGIPYIGTALTMLPWPVVAAMTAAVTASRAPINLELHGIDFLDNTDPGVSGALAERQRDVTVPVAVKVERLERVLRSLRSRRHFLRLDELAGMYL